MTFADRLVALCRERRSHLCVGLDPQPERLPEVVRGGADPVFAFNRAIVDATIDFTPVYKPNLAFYEALGLAGWTSLQRTVEYVAGRAIVLADAKRGDIDNTQTAYAKAMFEVFGFDAATVSVYPGRESAEAFLRYAEKGVFVLCRTSNRSGDDLQNLLVDGRPLYQHVAGLARAWNGRGNCGLVVGATYPAELAEVVRTAPGLPVLIPGAGAQGGDVEASVRAAGDSPFVVNSSRGIIYAGSGGDFAEAARTAALRLRDEIEAVVVPTS